MLESGRLLNTMHLSEQQFSLTGILPGQQQLGYSWEVERDLPEPLCCLGFQNPSGVESGGEIKLTKTAMKSPSSSNLESPKEISPVDVKQEVRGWAERPKGISLISLARGKWKLIKIYPSPNSAKLMMESG